MEKDKNSFDLNSLKEVESTMHKTSPYFRTLVALHNLRERAKDMRESLETRPVSTRLYDGIRGFFTHPPDPVLTELPQKYGYIFRPKSRWELVLLSGPVCGIEFCYSAETAFVTPTLLRLGVNIRYVSMMWCLSPLLGFFLSPVLGSVSDGCRLSLGRRRPFIILYSLGIILGLLLVPHGQAIGDSLSWSFGVSLTVLGTVFLDLCCDACQSPSRTYLLDVSLPEDHASGLSTFTLMAGLGGSLGYVMGGIHWENTSIGEWLGGQISAVFALVTLIFVVCLLVTVVTFPEIPLPLLQGSQTGQEFRDKMVCLNSRPEEGNEMVVISQTDYGTEKKIETSEKSSPEPVLVEPSLRDYLLSLVKMPSEMRFLCLTNFFCWSSLLCYSLYFTDFVAESVFMGEPGSTLYEEGVRFGCWGMAIYSCACAVYSNTIERLIRKIGARSTYIGGHVVYCVGMVLMATLRTQAAVIVLSTTAGIMYATLFTMPYILIARYHCTHLVGRGMGTDVAAVGSMVFLSQFLLSLTMGSLVEAVGSKVATICSAATLSACAALTATKVHYADL